MNIRTAFIIVSLAVVSVPLSAAVPRFLFIPVGNASGNKDFDYIGGSISTELKKQISDRFAVSELPDSDWESLARKNDFIFADEFSTRSVSLQLGIILKRDIVLSGIYRVMPARKKGDPDTLLFNIYLLGIRDKVIISNVSFETPADGTIFAKTEHLRDRIVAELAKVLPA